MTDYKEGYSSKNVTGHLVKLSDERLVFLGESPEYPDVFYVGFRNKEGDDTKFLITREAKEALTELLTEKFKGAREPWPFSIITKWKVTVVEKD